MSVALEYNSRTMCTLRDITGVVSQNYIVNWAPIDYYHKLCKAAG